MWELIQVIEIVRLSVRKTVAIDLFVCLQAARGSLIGFYLLHDIHQVIQPPSGRLLKDKEKYQWECAILYTPPPPPPQTLTQL